MAWAPSYATAQELWDWSNQDLAESTIPAGYVDTYEMASETASRAVDLFTNRQFGQCAAVEARYFTASYDPEIRCWVVDIDDLMDATGLVIEADLLGGGDYDYTLTDYALAPHNAAPKSRPWTRVIVRRSETNQPNCTDHGVKVTAKWGWTSVPVAVKQATILQANRIQRRYNSPFGVALAQDTADVRLLDKVDPDLAVALRPYVRMWAVA